MGLLINATGTVITGLVLAINGVTRFFDGAGVIVLIVPVLVAACFAVHSHYVDVSSHLTTEIATSPDQLKLVCLVPIADLNALALQSLAMARSISDNVIAVHVCDDEEHIARMRALGGVGEPRAARDRRVAVSHLRAAAASLHRRHRQPAQ